MAETVSVREFRHNLAAYLERANGGEEIVITRAGRLGRSAGTGALGYQGRGTVRSEGRGGPVTGSARGGAVTFAALSGLRPVEGRRGVNVRQGAAKAWTAPGTIPSP